MTATPTLKTVLPPAAFVLLAGLLLALAWGDLERWTRASGLPVNEAGTIAADVPEPSGPSTGARADLAGMALFGQAESTTPEAPPAALPPQVIDESALPESSAGYQLYGIIEADERERGRAILAGTDGEQREYRVGDTMPDGALVHAVRERAVVFERNGALERLALPSADTGDTGAMGTTRGGLMSPTPSLPNAGYPNMPGVPRVAIPGMNGIPSQLAPPMPAAPPDAVPAPIAEMPLESPPVTQ